MSFVINNSDSDSINSSNTSSFVNVGSGSLLLAIIAAATAPIVYAINGILDKTVISIRVRFEKGYIALVGCLDTLMGYKNIYNYTLHLHYLTSFCLFTGSLLPSS